MAFSARQTTAPDGINFPTLSGDTVITLTNTKLPKVNDAAVALTGSYTLALSDTSETYAANDTTKGNYWTVTAVAARAAVEADPTNSIEAQAAVPASTTVKYTYDSKAGFEASNSNKTLTYKASAAAASPIFTITGLKDGIAGKDSDKIGTEADKFSKIDGISFNATTSTQIDLANDVLVEDTRETTLTLGSGTGYTLALGANAVGADVPVVNLWTVEKVTTGDLAGTYTATYAEYKPKHFTVTSNNKITFTDLDRTKEDGTDKPALAVITGLKFEDDDVSSYLTADIDNTTLAGITLPTAEEIDAGTKAIKLASSVLFEDATKPATLITTTTNKYETLTFADASDEYKVLTTKSWVVDDPATEGATTTTATYQTNVSGGKFVIDTEDGGTKNKKITYRTDHGAIPIVKLSGISNPANDTDKTALETMLNAVDEDTGDPINVVVDDTASSEKITLNKAAIEALLPSTSGSKITSTQVTGQATYTLALKADATPKVGADSTIKFSVGSGTATVKGDVVGYKLADANTGIVSAAATGVTFGQITGLTGGGSLTFANGTITIPTTRLGDNDITFTPATDTDVNTAIAAYKLGLEESAATKKLKADTQAITVAEATQGATSTTATVKGTLFNYSLDTRTAEANDNQKIKVNAETDQTLATITGLKVGTTKGAEGIDFASTNSTQIKVAIGALNGADITLTQEDIANSDIAKYSLDWKSTADGIRRTAQNKDVWRVEGDTGSKKAVYKEVTQDYYTLDDKSETDTTKTKISYHAEAETTTGKHLEITGLKEAALTVTDDKITDIEFDTDNPKKVKLASSVLPDFPSATAGSQTTISIQSFNYGTDDEKYSLALADDTTNAYQEIKEPPSIYWTIADGTQTGTKKATYQYATQTGYKDSNGNLVYTSKENSVLCVIDGLNSNIAGTQIADQTIGVLLSAIAGITLDKTTGVITLDSSVLTDKNVTLTDTAGDEYSFSLALADNVWQESMAKEVGTGRTYTWSVKDGANSTKTATYQRSTHAYYTLATGNKSISYTEADTGRTLATITNLNSNVVLNAAGKVGIGEGANFVEGIKINGGTGKEKQIDILNGDVLSTDNTKQTKFMNEGVAGETYTFDLKADKDDANDVPTSDTVANINLWTVTKDDATNTYTATYAEYKPEFFTLNDDDSVTYTELKRARNGQVSKDAIAVITGLTIDSTTANDYKTADISHTTLAGITLPTGTSKAITLDTALLAKKEGSVISLSGTGDYTIAVKETADAWGLGDNTKTYWAVKEVEATGTEGEEDYVPASKTANYQYDTKGGYKADNDANAKTLTYTASTPTVVATITGLNADVAVDTEGEVGNQLLTADDEAGITVNGKVFTIANQGVLQAGNVKLDGDYTFAALTDNIDKPSDIDTSKGDDGNYWTLTDVKEKEATATTAAVPATKTATYQYDYKAGYTLDSGSKSITYTAAKASAPLATITGLSPEITGDNGDATGKYSELTGINVNVTSGTGSSATGTIEITDSIALTTSDVNLTSDKYTLALDDDIEAPDAPDINSWYFTIDEDTTTNTSTVNYKYDLQEGYELDTTNKKITYTAVTPTTVATITGLATGLKTASATEVVSGETDKYSAVAGITYTAPVAEGEEADDPDTTNVDESKAQAGIFKLNTDALTTGNVALTTTKDLFTGGKAYLNSYTLALQTTEGDTSAAGDVPTEAADGLIWTVSPVGGSNKPTSTKAYLNPTKEPYYTLGTNGNAVTYNPQVVNASILTISGLAPAVYTATKSASKEPTANKNAFATYLSFTPYQAEVKAVADDPSTENVDETVEARAEQIGKVKLKAAALNNASVTLTGTDKYVIDSTSEFTKPTESITGWKLVSGNPVLYGKITAEGYALKPDGMTLDYTAVNTTDADLVKIEGFNSGLVIPTDGTNKGKLGMNIGGSFVECIKYDATNNTVTISNKAVLGASDVEFTTNKIGYTLKLDASSGIQSTKQAKDVWREKTAGSGTYEYKNVNLAYYTEATDGSGAIEYHAEEANKTKNVSNADVDIVYATITGLKGNLGDITTGQISVTGTTAPLGATADDEDADANKYIVTILNKEVLDQTTASITSGMDTVAPTAGEAYASAVYSLAIDDACKPAIGTDTGSKWWEAEDKSGSTTATYHAACSDGYKLKDDGKIYYVNAKDDVTLATITGLKSGLTKDALNATENAIIVPTLASGNLSVELTAGVLGDTDATIAMTDAVKEDYSLSDYNLKLDSGVKKVGDATAADGWWLTKDTTSSLTTATWANITPYYYTIFATADQTKAAATEPTSGKKIKYTGDAITKNTKGNEITYFKVTGLSKDLVLNPDAAYGVYTSAGTMDGTAFNEGLTFATSNTVKAKANVLSEKVTLVPITTDSEVYALTYDYVAANGDTPKVKNYTYKLEFADGTATLKQGNEAYYEDGLTEPDGKVIKYHAAVDPDTVVTTVTGLSKASDLLYALQGATANAWSLVYYKDGQTDETTAVSFTAPANENDRSTAKKVTIEDATALSKASVEVTGDYTLGLKDGLATTIESKASTDIWYRDETAGTLTYYTGASEGYNLDTTNNKLVYTAFDPKTSTKNVAIKGLDLKVGNNGANVGTYDDDGNFTAAAGVSVDKSNKKVTLNLAALGTSNVDFADDASKADYEFVLDGKDANNHVGFTTKDQTWTVKSGTVTYKLETDKGFTLSNDKDQIRYTAPTTVTATITGLDKTKVADAFTENTTTGKLEPDATKKLISVTTTPKAAVAAVPYTEEGATANLYDAEAQVKGVINISSDLFGTSDVAVSSDGKSKGLTYKFNVAGATSYNPATTTTAPKVITEVIPAWNVKSGKATYDKTAPKDSYVSNTDGDKLTYYKAEKVISTIATIAGLDKAITAANFTANVAVEAPTDHNVLDAEGNPVTNTDGINQTENYGTITLSKGALPTATKGTLKVTLTNGKEGTYRLALDTTSASTEKKVDAPEDKDPIWIANGKGTATYQYQTTAGYVVGNSSKDKVADVITASAETWTPIVTLTGVNKKLAYTATDNVTSLDGIKMDGTTDANHNPILTLTAEDGKADTIYALDNTTIKLKNNTKDAAWKADVGTAGSWAAKLAQQGYESAQFKLAVDDSVSSIGHGAEWSFNNGTATLAAGTTAGYAMKNTTAADTAEYKKATSQKAVVTITGLPKTKDTSITMDGSGNVKIGTSDTVKQGLEVLDNAGGKYTVKVYSDLLDTVTSGTIKVKEANAYLSIDGQSKLTYAEGESGAWNIVKGKATLDRTVATAGHTLSADGKSITYTPTTKSNKPVVETLATITGLDKNLTMKSVLNSSDGEFYVADSDGKATTTLMSDYISLPVTNEKGKNIVTLGKGVLSTSKITIKGANKTDSYALALDSGINTTKKTTIHWDISGNKASLVKGDEAYYTIDSKTGGINYNKAGKASTTYVTVTGIDKTKTLTGAITNYSSYGTANEGDSTTADLIADMTAGTVTLNNNAFDTTPKSIGKTKVYVGKNDAYTLALGTGTTAAVTQDSWKYVKGKANLERNVSTSGYMLSGDGKTITYGLSDDTQYAKKTKATTLATISGVGAAPNASVAAGIAMGSEISIGSAQLNNAKVTLKVTSGDYYLKLADGQGASLSANPTWGTPKNGKVSLTGIIDKAGYAQSDNYTINYIKPTTPKATTIATVSGLSTKVTVMSSAFNSATNTVTMSEADLKDAKNVTVDGGGVAAFDFSNKYYGNTSVKKVITGTAKDDTITAAGGNVSITTAAGNDSISITGGNVTVNAGKGNDYVDLGDGTGNVFIYASGDGNDIVADFTNGTDKLDVKAVVSSVDRKANSNDVIISVDKGKSTITVKNYDNTAATITVGSKAYDIEKGIGATDLLLDNNYSMTAAANDLSEIIKADTGSYSPYQFSDSLKLTKEENFIPQIAYGSNKK